MDNDRKEIWKTLRDQFIESLKQDFVKFIDDPLCTVESIHITGTEEQAKCLLWFQKRCFLVTASGFKVSPNKYVLTLVLSINPVKYSKTLCTFRPLPKQNIHKSFLNHLRSNPKHFLLSFQVLLLNDGQMLSSKFLSNQILF